MRILHADGTRGHLREYLLDHGRRLLHLLHAHEYAIVGVTAMAERYVPIEFVIVVIGMRAPHVVGHAGRAQARAGETP